MYPQHGRNHSLTPWFYTIMSVSREAHLVACLWSKRRVQEISKRLGSGLRFGLWMRFQELIEDVSGNEMAVGTVVAR